MSNVVIHHGNCLDVLPSLEDQSVDVVITSPPYNIGIKYNSYKDSLPHGEYLSFLRQVFIEIHRVLKNDGSFFLNIGSKPSSAEAEHEVLQVALNLDKQKKLRFHLQNSIIWVKSIAIEDDTRGHYKPINSPYYLNGCYEPVYHLNKSTRASIDKLAIGVPYKDKSCVNRYGKGIDLHDRGNVWFIPYKTTTKAKKHPAGFPITLPEWCIKLHGVKDGLTVLDPFMGTGTTLQACQELKVKGIGIELDLNYFNQARYHLGLC